MEIGRLRAWAENPSVIHTESKKCKFVHKLSTKGWITTIERGKNGSNKG